METIQKSVTIHCRVAEVFDYLADATHLLEIWPSMAAISNATTSEEGAHRFDWVYKMAGIPFRGHSQTAEVRRNRLRVDRNSGIPSTFRWVFDQANGFTTVALYVEYDLPPVVGKLAAPVLRRINEREADTMLQNLKKRLETGTVPVRRKAE